MMKEDVNKASLWNFKDFGFHDFGSTDRLPTVLKLLNASNLINLNSKLKKKCSFTFTKVVVLLEFEEKGHVIIANCRKKFTLAQVAEI
jgi:hypothetical protein